ncbi:PAS-domain containing protein [Magnetospirillum sp. SS-4]|uniref:PAS-domain containing protein n=1 Tax=Magnetospirillum sp. SS-4 TaxID=2681465 RepID=UPI0020C2859F|nr:PAS-domain containing protein [Magnetospirillum sp. SS-4]
MSYLQWELEHSAVAQWQKERGVGTLALARGFDRSIRDMTDDLKMAAHLPAMATVPEAHQVDRRFNGIPPGVDVEKRTILDSVMGHGHFSVLFVLLPNGDHYLSHPYEVQARLTRFNLADRGYFQEATRTGEPVVSDAFVGADGVPAVVINIPRRDSSGNIVLHLGGVLHLERMKELFAATIAEPFDVALLLDRRGQVIAASRHAEDAGLSEDALIAAVRRFQAENPRPGEVVSRVYSDPGRDEEVLANLVGLESGWAVALARGRSTFISQIRPEVSRITAIVGGLLLLVSALGFAIASHVAGRWDAARLALAVAHDELEDRVRQRTADLDHSRRELQRKTATLETIMDNISQGISLYDRDLRLVICNRRFIELLGLPSGMDRPGTPLADYFRYNAERGEYGPCDVDELVARRLELAANFLPHRFQRIRPDGRVLEVVGTPLPDGGFVTTHADITETKRSQESLLTLSRAVEQSPVSVVITDPRGNIEYVNPKFVAVTGYGPDEVRGQNPRILKSGMTQDATYHDLWSTISDGRTWEGEMQNRRKNGELFWERASISPIRSPDGAVIHYLAVKEDITQRKQAEADLRAAWQAADEANRAKTVFLSHMSHELRTPLTAVLGYSEMMALEVAGPLPPAYAGYVDSIVVSGRHLLAIIDEVLDITRIELGSYRIEQKPTDFTAIGRECVAMLRPQCIAKAIGIDMDEGAAVRGGSDERAVRQILINLLGNAIKYTPRGGSITLAVGRGDDASVRLVIADTGCGIPADKLDHVFDPFQRVDPLRADPARGVGLGLAICHRLAGLLGGSIAIESRPGAGTTVTVVLPAVPVADCVSETTDTVVSRV